MQEIRNYYRRNTEGFEWRTFKRCRKDDKHEQQSMQRRDGEPDP